MRRTALLAGSIVGLMLAGAAGGSLTPTVPFDRASISAKQCTPAGSGARQIVDVSFVITNYADSGYADQWAIDTVNRHLRIWRHSDGTFCAQVEDEAGKFISRAGPSPTGNASIKAGITGTFEGGYITLSIVGKFKPGYPTHGNLGTFDARCDSDFTCLGPHPTWLSYFKNPVANPLAHWGWIYHGGKYGTWIDQENVVPPYGGDIRG